MPSPFEEQLSGVTAAPSEPTGSPFQQQLQEGQPSASEYEQRSRAAGAAVGRTGEEQRQILGARGFSPEQVKQLGTAYELEQARQKYANDENPLGSYAIGRTLGSNLVTRGLANWYRNYAPLAELNDAKGQKDYGAALTRFKQGQASQEDVDKIARYEQLQKDDQNGTFLGSRFAAKAIGSVGSLSKIYLETQAGSAALRGVGGLVGGKLGQALATAGGAESTASRIPYQTGLDFAKRSLAERAGSYMGRMAILTPMVPAMYLEQARQRNLEEGRDPNGPDAWKGFPGPMLQSYGQMLVLGQLQNLAGGKNVLGEVARRTGLGLVEQQGVDTSMGLADEFMPDLLKTKTKYGAVGTLLGLGGKKADTSEALQEVALQALGFATFAGLHVAQQGGSTKAVKEAAQRKMGEQNAMIDDMDRHGWGRQKVAETMGLLQKQMADANATPEQARAAFENFPIKSVRDQLLKWLNEAPKPGEPVKAPEAATPTPAPEPAASKPVETPKAAPAPTDPLSHVSDSDLRDFAKAMGVPAKGSRQVILAALAGKKISPDVVAAFFPRAETAKPPETPTVAPEGRPAGAGETPSGPEIARPGASESPGLPRPGEIVKTREGMSYRAASSADDAHGQDRSFSRGLDWYEGEPFLFESHTGPSRAAVSPLTGKAHHPGHEIGNVDKPIRIYYHPEDIVEEVRHELMTKELSKLREENPNAELVRIKRIEPSPGKFESVVVPHGEYADIVGRPGASGASEKPTRGAEEGGTLGGGLVSGMAEGLRGKPTVPSIVAHVRELASSAPSIETIKELRGHLEKLSKAEVEDVSKQLGYTPSKSKAETINRLEDNLLGIRMSKDRMHNIITGENVRPNETMKTKVEYADSATLGEPNAATTGLPEGTGRAGVPLGEPAGRAGPLPPEAEVSPDRAVAQAVAEGEAGGGVPQREGAAPIGPETEAHLRETATAAHESLTPESQQIVKNDPVFRALFEEAGVKIGEPVQKLGERRAAESEPAGESLADRLRAANDSAVGLSPEQKAAYHAADANILNRMPKAAQERMGKNLENVHVFADTDTMAVAGHRDLLNHLEAEHKAAKTPQEREKIESQIAYIKDQMDRIVNGEKTLGGLYIAKTNGVYVDGGWKPGTQVMRGRYGLEQGQEIGIEQLRAHEYGHSIDGPNREFSSSAEWKGPNGAWTKDIRGVGKNAPLSEYGGDPRMPSEGFAEFCRLLYGTDIPTAQIARDFPNASKFFKDRGLWPPERGGNAEGSAKLSEAFKERIPSDPSQPSHMDVRNDEPLVQAVDEEKGKSNEDEKALANQVTNEMRDRMGLPPIVKGQPVYNEAVWAGALNKIANDPGIATRLVNELEAKPRATTVEENAILLHQRITMSKEHDTAIRQALAGRARGIPDAEQVVLDARQSTAMDEINRLDQVIARTGTETGRSLQFRRQLAREDYSLSTMLGRATLAKGSMLTPDEVKEVHDLHMEVVKADEKLAAAEPGTREAKIADASAKVESAVVEVSKAKDEHTKAVEDVKTAATPEAKAAAEEKVAAAKEDVKKAVEAVVEAKADKVRVEKESKLPKLGEKGDITDLRIESRAAKKRFEEKIDSIQFANLPPGKKVIRTLGEAFNAVRSIRTSFDLSAVFRQGGIYAFTHPIKAAKAIPEMLRALGSERAYERAQDAIRNRANGHLYESSGLYLADRAGPLTAREEAFIGHWTSKIPGVKASERAYNAFLNRIRADLFDAGKEYMSRTTKPDPEGMRALANYINVVTGRGPLGVKGERVAGPLATLFFSPRYVVSRFQVLAGQPLYGGTAASRAFVAREYARLLAGLGVLYGIASMDDNAKITFDPRSSDFGKIRYGNTRVDPLAGLAQASVFVTRLVSGETKKQKGQIVPLRDQMRYSASGKVPYGGDTVPDVVSRFIRSKFAPVPGAVADALAGKNVVGEKTTVASTAGNLTVPMSVKDVYKSLEDQGVPRGAAIGLLAILGMGAQTYEPKKPKNESTLEQILR